MRRARDGFAVWAILVVLASCGEGPSEPDPAPAHPPAPTGAPQRETEPEPADFEGRMDPLENAAEATGIAELVEVRTARHAGYDRVVFEFAGELPGYRVAYAEQDVHQCGSGRPIDLAGGAALEVRLEPAVAHTEAGAPTVTERERSIDLPALREAELTCDFEAVVSWALGVESAEPFRVLEVASPPRLVVDVRHP